MDWKDEYSVGDEQFDADHKRIFDMINELESASDSERRPEFIELIFETLMDYTDDHFAREEQFMRDTGFAGVVEHHAKHAEMDEKLHGLFIRFRDGDRAVADDVVEFLRQWWYVHILQEDMAYKKL